MKRIIIGTGYCAHVIEDQFAADPAVTCIRMDRFRDTNSMYTLRGMQEAIDEDFLALEGDVLYEARAIDFLVKQEERDVILGSGQTDSGDEVYIETDEMGLLVNMSKDVRMLNRVDAEIVGLCKLSLDTYRAMGKFAERHVTFHPAMYYEEGLIEMAAHRPIKVAKLEDLIWCEIDDRHHLQRAEEQIWPAIAAREGQKIQA